MMRSHFRYEMFMFSIAIYLKLRRSEADLNQSAGSFRGFTSSNLEYLLENRVHYKSKFVIFSIQFVILDWTKVYVLNYNAIII